MDLSVYKQLMKEQRDRYRAYREQNPFISEKEAQRFFYNQRHEINITNIINSYRLAEDILRHLHLSRR